MPFWLAGLQAAPMKIVMENPITVGDTLVAAISLSTSSRHGVLSAFSVTVAKRPVGILLRHNFSVAAFDVTGAKMALSKTEKLCPGAVARLKAAPLDTRQTD